MATIASNLPSGEHETFASDLAGVFSFLMDPTGAARRLDRKWFWITPLLILSIASAIYTFVSGPMVAHFLETSPIPPNVTPEQYAQQMRMSAMIYRVLPLLMPVMIVVVALIQAAVLLATSSMLAVRARFLQLFNLIAGCSIISTLQMLAWVLILTAKREISNMTDLKPPLGLDIILPQGTNKFLLATLSYFSIFQIWWIVMAMLVYSVAFRTTKGKAAGAVLPMILLGLILTLVGAIFQKT
jgi:Yip1-like protein